MLSLRLRPDTELHSPHRQPHIPTKDLHCEIVKQDRDCINQLNHINHKHLTWIIFLMFIIQCIGLILGNNQSYIHVHHTTLNKETIVHHTVIGNIYTKRVILIFLLTLICGIRIAGSVAILCYFCFPNVISIDFLDVISVIFGFLTTN